MITISMPSGTVYTKNLISSPFVPHVQEPPQTCLKLREDNGSKGDREECLER